YHRGVYTTHHNIKQRNAQLERKLSEAECAVARCIANRTISSDIRESCREIDEAWLLVLRNQFHDVLPGTSIAEVYGDVHQEYDRAERLIERVMRRAYDVIPPSGVAESRCVVPEAIAGGAYLFHNGLIEARVLADGSIDLLRTSGGPNVASRANLLTLYRDVPREWDAWNIDADYRNQKWLPRIERCTVDGDTLVVQLIFGKSRFTMCVCLREREPFLRITLKGDWSERHTLLRCENALIVDTDRVIYGTPHGTIERSSLAQTPQERAKFEVPGQRFAVARSQQGGTAVFSLDTYGWSASRDGRGLHLGHSLLRSPMWPQRDADAGSQMLTYALAPLDNASLADVERLWLRFAEQTACTLFEIDQRNVLVVACKPTHEGDRAIVRIRECDGVACRARVRCEQRFTSVERVNALEERIDRIASNDDASFEAAVSPYELQSFRVQF
ncbi:MAG: hypothetical protein JOZ97_09030, partial [Candidatus Eremiobacteraeota bacterium]|nr:hypothetical protein [Candidatus Eremiobacteraeota bacterium]